MFRIATWVGVLAIAITIGLIGLFPAHMGPLPAGMRTPIVAFELARTHEEVESMFGPPASPEREVWRRAMDLGNYADFAYLLVYGTFLVTFTRALAAPRARLAALAGIPSGMDVAENLQLLAITRALGGDYDEALRRLQLFTWGKWFAIAAVCAAWIPALWSRGKLGRAGAAFALFTLITTVTAFWARGVAAELMPVGVALTLTSALMLAVRGLKAERLARG